MNIKLEKYYLSELEKCKTLFDLTWWVIDYGNQVLLWESILFQKSWNGDFNKDIAFRPYTTNPRFKTVNTRPPKEQPKNYPRQDIWEKAGFTCGETYSHPKLKNPIYIGEEYIYEIKDCTNH